MNQTQRRILLFVPATALLLNELIRSVVRPVYGRSRYGLLSTVLGWLPNLLAPFAWVAMGLVLVLLLQSSRQPLARKWRWWLLLLVVASGLLGFIQHEFAQCGSGLYFDYNDIWATVAGTALGALLYWAALLRGRD